MQLQVYAKKDQLPERDFQLYQLLDIGDFIGVEGTLFRTRTGELTVLAKELSFLAKSFLPLPEKWHGLTDVEIRYRRRYVDLVVNPEVRDVFVKRSLIIRELRRFLDDRATSKWRRRSSIPSPAALWRSLSRRITTRSTCRFICGSRRSCI